MKYNITLNGRTFEIEVELAEAMSMESFRAAMPAAPAAMAAAPVDAPSAPTVPAVSVAGEAVTAPMPGTILRVNVQQGQRVKEGDLLCVLEAMKMENEIFSPKAGTVTQIVAAKGASVNTGDLLVAIN